MLKKKTEIAVNVQKCPDLTYFAVFMVRTQIIVDPCDRCFGKGG
jgi:hypothetical protein